MLRVLDGQGFVRALSPAAKVLLKHLAAPKLAMRAVVVFESLAKVPMTHLLWDMLDAAGLPRADVVVAVAVPEDMRDCKRRQIVAGREQLKAALGDKSAVLLVGNAALESITDKKGIKQRRGKPFTQDGCVFVPTLPPGVMAYDERTRPMIDADLKLFADVARTGQVPREDRLDWTIIDCRRKFDDMLADLRGTVSFDIETGAPGADGELEATLNPWRGHVGADGEWVIESKVISVGFGTRDRQWCLPLNHPQAKLFGLTHAQMIAHVDRRLAECYLVAHNGKFDSLWMKIHYGVDWRVDFDTMLAHWMVDENQRHSLKLLAQLYFGAPNYDVDKDEKGGAGPLGKHCEYLAHDVYYTRALRFKLGKLLREDGGVERAFSKILMPIARLFVDVEHHGALVDVDRFEEAEIHLRNQLKQAERELTGALMASGLTREEAKAINWRSPKQIAELFFDRLGIDPIPVKRKKGKGVNERSTAETVLKQITHPVAVALMKHRGTDQMLKMFIDGWRPFLVKHADGWRLHPVFKLHGTVTGRASAEKPNLQQTPRDELIRSLIGAALGWELVEIDLSQIEMRLAAELSGDQTLLGLFRRDEDVHWMTAIREIGRGVGMKDEVLRTAGLFVQKYPKTEWLSKTKWVKHQRSMDYATALDIVYRMGPDVAAELMPIWKELRKKAKAINFGYLFGMWWKKMVIYARDNYGVHLTDKQAQESRKVFFSTYSGLAPWHERQRRHAQRHGYVRSLSGALRRLPAATSHRDSPERGEALRQAINSPVQRFACELNFMVLLQLVEEFPDVVRPIATVHDAILMEVKSEWIERVYLRAEEIMRHPALLDELKIKLSVPIKGDAKIGNWSKGVSLKKWKEKVRA